MSGPHPGAIVTVPEIAVIDEVREEIEDVRTFHFSFEDPAVAERFRIRSGQFVMCTVFGAGEFAVSLPFSPEGDRPHLSVRQVGKVTRALHELRAGDKIGIRGPFGNGFPFEAIKGKNVVYVAGGIGLIPLRSSIVHVLQHRKDFGRIVLIYGSRSSKERDGPLRGGPGDRAGAGGRVRPARVGAGEQRQAQGRGGQGDRGPFRACRHGRSSSRAIIGSLLAPDELPGQDDHFPNIDDEQRGQ